MDGGGSLSPSADGVATDPAILIFSGVFVSPANPVSDVADDTVARDFRHVMGHFPSGVTIVTAIVDGVPCGMTCQSFFSLSLDPPLIAFSPAKTSRSYAEIRRGSAFCINILSDTQQHVCSAFARSGADKFAGVAWTGGTTGSPILDEVVAWIDCTVEAEHDAGDHWLVIGRVRGLAAQDRPPLLYHRGGFHTLVAA